MDDKYKIYDVEPVERCSRGLRATIPGIIDECCDYCFDPGYTIDKDGNIHITEISLIRKST